MRPGETIEAPNMGMRVTCRESAAGSGGALLSFELWMRGGATPPPMHVHPHQEERITVMSGSVQTVPRRSVLPSIHPATDRWQRCGLPDLTGRSRLE